MYFAFEDLVYVVIQPLRTMSGRKPISDRGNVFCAQNLGRPARRWVCGGGNLSDCGIGNGELHRELLRLTASMSPKLVAPWTDSSNVRAVFGAKTGQTRRRRRGQFF